MPEQEKAHKRIQTICNTIRNETLEPAKEEADRMLAKAQKEAEATRLHAQEEAEAILSNAREQMEQEKRFFESSLQQASKQTIETFKQQIEQSLFLPAIQDWVEKTLAPGKAQADLLSAIVEAVKKEGIEADLSAAISNKFSAEDLTAHLGKQVLDRLENNTVQLADIPGGVQVRMVGKHIMLDISTKTIEELVARFIRKDFRKFFFNK